MVTVKRTEKPLPERGQAVPFPGRLALTDEMGGEVWGHRGHGYTLCPPSAPLPGQAEPEPDADDRNQEEAPGY